MFRSSNAAPPPLVRSSYVHVGSDDSASSASTDLIPLVSGKLDSELMRRMPGVLFSASSAASSGDRHTGRKSKKNGETSIAFGLSTKVPGIARHISGKQMIRVQATLQDPDAYNTSTTVPTYYAQYFTLGQLANATAYTALFDEYMIEEVEVWAYPNAVSTLAASTQRGQWSTAVDYDDANTPSTVSTVSDKQNSLTTSIDECHYHKFKPRFAVGTYSGTFASFASQTGWVDCASPNVQHYGFKSAVSATAGGIQFVSIVVRMTIAFRSPGIS
jgi:hypothetical protein